MKNTINEGQFSFLVYRNKDKFIGICKETGYVEEGNNAEEVLHRLTNGAKAILLTVKEHPELLPSINQHPPLKYLLLFYWIPIYFGLKNIWNTPELQRLELTSLQLCNTTT